MASRVWNIYAWAMLVIWVGVDALDLQLGSPWANIASFAVGFFFCLAVLLEAFQVRFHPDD